MEPLTRAQGGKLTTSRPPDRIVMASRRRLNDSLLGLLISALLVAIACWVLVTIDRHREEHGHNASAAPIDVKGMHRPEDGQGGEGQDAGGGHGVFVTRSSLSTPLNKVVWR